jgi:hypothetical protein
MIYAESGAARLLLPLELGGLGGYNLLRSCRAASMSKQCAMLRSKLPSEGRYPKSAVSPALVSECWFRILERMSDWT